MVFGSTTYMQKSNVCIRAFRLARSHRYSPLRIANCVGNEAAVAPIDQDYVKVALEIQVSCLRRRLRSLLGSAADAATETGLSEPASIRRALQIVFAGDHVEFFKL